MTTNDDDEHENQNLIKLRRFEIYEVITIILTLFAFADVYKRLGQLELDCYGINKNITKIRSKRAAAPPPLRNIMNTSRTDVWMHSLSKIKV